MYLIYFSKKNFKIFIFYFLKNENELNPYIFPNILKIKIYHLQFHYHFHFLHFHKNPPDLSP